METRGILKLVLNEMIDNKVHFEEKGQNAEGIIRLVLKGLLPVVLVFSGLALLYLNLSGWSIILGLPMLVIGSVFIIYTYDDIFQKRIEPIRGALTNCIVCGKPTPIIAGVDKGKTVCHKCQELGR